ncbi:hypothetical protein Q8F55_007608 [Vanrija albida]|uniref:S1-like domain-containing protein n=1 Tax=Vanrija albida TaxID=181172 RepID=A0ABR3PU01_9TREE
MAPKPQSYYPSTLPDDHRLVRLGPPQGSGNFTCTDTAGAERLVEMPARVRRTAYAARGSFAIVQLYAAAGRVAGEIVHVVQGDEIKAWRRAGEWPAVFDVVESTSAPAAEPAVADDSDDEPLPENPNRRHVIVDESDSDEDSDDE